MKQKSAFTLAEVMIVLVIIGVLSAVLIPTAIKSKPDEAKMKFENTLSSIATTTREVVSSDEYFLDGDMSKKINGTSSTSINVCSAFANTLNFKTSNCNNTNSTTDTSNPDEDCANSSNKAQITTKNGVEYFFSSNAPFTNENSQKTICFDIDGIGKGEAPFGLKLRADGKITYGARALTWSGSTPESVNTPAEEEKEDITCEEAYAIEQQNCEKISEFVTPEFCATLPGKWVYERGYMSCKNPSKCGLDSCYFDTEEEYKALRSCAVSGIVGDPVCRHEKCRTNVGSSVTCDLVD